MHTSEKKYFAMRLKPLYLASSTWVLLLSKWMMMTSGWTNHLQWSSDTLVTLIHIPQAITPTRPKHCQAHDPSVEIKSNCQSVSHANRFCGFSGKLINVLDKECECSCGAPEGFYVVIMFRKNHPFRQCLIFSPWGSIPDTSSPVSLRRSRAKVTFWSYNR